ncbi:MAG: ATP-grasp domain-containing protein [Lachnospiraceae bacterium]|nr:ATP-grasp domain-containing protein [Lachnospiraceae bacterium]
MNFVFTSPQFPTNYWKFCAELKKNGANVLGIGDQDYNSLTDELKSSLTEYYKVSSMENYDEMMRAVAFFTFKYGKIDWIESNNEYWLEQDAKLRTDFNVTTGPQSKDMDAIKYKSKMKANYAKAGVPAAKYHLVSNYEEGKAFVEEVGYPVIVKPDNGVGASNTYKLKNDAEFDAFYANLPSVQYIMEEFVNGQVCSYDALVNSKGEILFETGNVTLVSIVDAVNDKDEVNYYIMDRVPDDLADAGRRTVKAFGVKSRLVHFEFFRLMEDKKDLGKKGDIVALEVNMRPCGGFTPDMINFANSFDIYKLWADMICYDQIWLSKDREISNCLFVGRRKGKDYKHSHEDIMNKYGNEILMHEVLPEVLATGMGDFMYVRNCKTMDELHACIQYMVEKK